MARRTRIRHALPDARWPTAEEAERAMLFSPIDVGPMRLVHRTWVPAMVPWRAEDSGEVTDALLEWYGRFAEGRPGAIVVEATGIRDIPSGPLLRIGDDRFIPGLRKLVDIVRERSGGHTKLLIQIIDFLAVKRRPEPAKYFQRYWKIDEGHRARLSEYHSDTSFGSSEAAELREHMKSASAEEVEAVLTPRELEALRFGYRERVTDLHLPHVRNLPCVLPDLFASAAGRAVQAGFHGVELHFAHAYTMASFLSRTNTRDDGYGGLLEGRARLPLEVYAACREVVKDRVALGCRFLGDEVIENGNRIDDAVYFADAFARAGMDFLSLSKGGKFDDAKQPRIGAAVYPYTGPSGHECMPTIYSDARGPFGRNLHLSRDVRAAVRKAGFDTPIVGAGGINTFELAEGALLNGDCDIVASARQSLCDPDWFEKARRGRGGDIRRCAMTNYCEGLDQQHKQVTCRLWDRAFDRANPDVMTSHDGRRRLVAPPWSES